MGSPDWVTKRDPINTQERGNVSSIPKSRTGLVQSLLSLHTHSSPAHPHCSQGTHRGHLPGGQPRQGDQAHQIPQVHPAQGKRGWKYSHFCKGMSFLLAQQSHCMSAAASSCFRLVRGCFTFSPTAPGFPIPPGGPCGPSAPGGPDGPLGPGGPGGP